METGQKTKITIEAFVKAPKDAVWKRWTTPEDIVQWINASDDWHTPNAKIDLRAGGEFLYRMDAKDGSLGFDFGGVFDTVKPKEFIAYTIGDGRKVEINFTGNGSVTSTDDISSMSLWGLFFFLLFEWLWLLLLRVFLCGNIFFVRACRAAWRFLWGTFLFW